MLFGATVSTKAEVPGLLPTVVLHHQANVSIEKKKKEPQRTSWYYFKQS